MAVRVIRGVRGIVVILTAVPRTSHFASSESHPLTMSLETLQGRRLVDGDQNMPEFLNAYLVDMVRQDGRPFRLWDDVKQLKGFSCIAHRRLENAKMIVVGHSHHLRHPRAVFTREYLVNIARSTWPSQTDLKFVAIYVARDGEDAVPPNGSVPTVRVWFEYSV